MKRLLLSVRLVGIVLIGYTPNPLQTNQVTPALAEPLNMTRAVPLALQRVALRGALLRRLKRRKPL
jgi:hypothetical protein